MAIDELVKEASLQTPDPERSLKNLERLLSNAPGMLKEHAGQIGAIAGLFSYSQYLADFCVNNPSKLVEALRMINEPATRQEILSEAFNRGFINRIDYMPGIGAAIEKPIANRVLPATFKKDAMMFLREIKKRYLLRVTIRDITGETTLDQCMAELSLLAEAILEIALDMACALMEERFGRLSGNPFAVIALGKLGAGELNYSSDIDILTVYSHEEGTSDGVVKSSGVRINRIDSHEYFCRLTELLSNMLMTQTEDGIAYRVDLRLRPDGRRGELSLSLNSYATYYESWGKTWERMALIRAKPVAGDRELGRLFVEAVEPFVWKKTTDYYDIDEIRELKRKIDTVFDANDIKRGYGGIREIEFFSQTFQLLYGGEKKNLRTGKLAVALDELLKVGFLTIDDVKTLLESYLFLRRVEHVLQMKDDVQTHTLPSKIEDLTVFSRKLGFAGEKEFNSELKLKRLKVRDMYNSLLGGPGNQQEAVIFLEDELTDNETKDYLAYKGFIDPDSALKKIKALNEQISIGKTIRERTLLRKTIPMFLEQILKTENKDRVLNLFVTFIEKIGSHEAYLDLFSKRAETVELIVNAFSESRYLSRALLSLENLESIFEYPDVRMDYKSVKERLLGMLEHSRDPMGSVREFRVIEEMRSGLLFLKGFLDIEGLSNALSVLAGTILRTTLKHLNGSADFAVVALGKFGSKELNIGSDLDLVFIASGEPSEASSKSAEELIRFLSEYTAKGKVYEVDMRLRPDGSKGVLVTGIEGYKNYYLKHAQPWEIQALLRARPVAGEKVSLKEFQDIKRQIILKRGREVTASDIRAMRERIKNELSKEAAGYDIKLGPGGIEEIEFLVQYLQLKHAAEYDDLIIHKTTTAIKRLAGHGIVNSQTAEVLKYAYGFMRTIEAVLRLNEEKNVLKTGSESASAVVKFMDFGSKEELFAEIERVRSTVLGVAEMVYSG